MAKNNKIMIIIGVLILGLGIVGAILLIKKRNKDRDLQTVIYKFQQDNSKGFI